MPNNKVPQSSDFSMATQDTAPDLPSPDDSMEEDNGAQQDEEFLSPCEDEAEDADDETDHTPCLFFGKLLLFPIKWTNSEITGPSAPTRKPTQPIKVTGTNNVNPEHSEQLSQQTEETGSKHENLPLIQRTAKHKKRK